MNARQSFFHAGVIGAITTEPFMRDELKIEPFLPPLVASADVMDLDEADYEVVGTASFAMCP